MAAPKKSTVEFRVPKDWEEDAGIAMKHVNYPMWFTDQMAKAYMGLFPARFAMCKSQEQWDKVYYEAQITASIYCLLVYKIYNEKEEFRKTIDSKPELSENFRMIKGWLDQRDGKAAAEEFIGLMGQEMLGSGKGEG